MKVKQTDNITINTLIEYTVHQYADKSAIHFGNDVLTYSQINEKVTDCCAGLTAKGVRKGDIVAICVDRSIDMVLCMLATLRLGASYIPIDPTFPAERIQFIIEDAGVGLLIVSAKYKGMYKACMETTLETILLTRRATRNVQSPEVKPGDIAQILYTSGSTGKPKGAKISHGNLANFLLSMQAVPGMKPSDRILAITTIAFDIAGLELYLPLITGAEIVLTDSATARDGRLLLQLVAEKHISVMQATPSTWQMMLNSGWEKKYDLKILCGGEPLSLEMASKLLKRCSELWNMYGPTETTIWSTVKHISQHDKQITVGRPIDNTQVYIMDEHQKILPTGHTGEICIGGAGVAAGYLNRDSLTAEKFIPDIHSGIPGSKIYRTGDLGRMLDSGDIVCLGRVDHQVKIRGHRIELGEIESAMLQSEDISQCVVIAREDDSLGKRLVAYVILDKKPAEMRSYKEAGNQLLIPQAMIEEWKRQLSTILPAYMLPENIVALKSFPLTPNAKVDRKALPRPIIQSDNDSYTRHTFTPEEQYLADIWRRILGIRDIKPADNFFENGGNSLLAVVLMTEIEKQTGKYLTTTTLFDNPTIERLAKYLSGNGINQWDILVPLKPTGNKTPLFLIHGAELNTLLLEPLIPYIDAEQPVYGLQAVGLANSADIPATLEGIAKRYVDEMLQVVPDGPYAIAGYSLGSFIAIEITRQLKAMDKHVIFLGILDGHAGDKDYIENKWQRTWLKLKRQFKKVPFIIRNLITYPRDAFEYQALILKRKLLQLQKHRNLSKEIIAEHTYTAYEEEIYNKYSFALDNYRIAPFDTRPTLFRVKKRLYYIDDPIYLGWSKYTLNGIDIIKVPGDHKTFLLPPNVKIFVKYLQTALDAANTHAD